MGKATCAAAPPLTRTLKGLVPLSAGPKAGETQPDEHPGAAVAACCAKNTGSGATRNATHMPTPKERLSCGASP